MLKVHVYRTDRVASTGVLEPYPIMTLPPVTNAQRIAPQFIDAIRAPGPSVMVPVEAREVAPTPSRVMAKLSEAPPLGLPPTLLRLQPLRRVLPEFSVPVEAVPARAAEQAERQAPWWHPGTAPAISPGASRLVKQYALKR